VVAFRDGGPEALVEEPMRIGGEGEAVAGIVVATLGMFVDVAGLHEGAVVGFEAVAGEGTGVVVAADDVGLKAGVAAFALLLAEGFGIGAKLGDGVSGFNYCRISEINLTKYAFESCFVCVFAIFCI
jgi:hypothetical protein